MYDLRWAMTNPASFRSLDLALISDEQTLAQAREQDRPLALRMLMSLPGRRLADIGLY